MVAGVLFNLLLAFFIYSMVLFTWNDTYLPLKNVTQGMEFSQAAKNAGFRDGDILLRADDKELERFGVRTLLDVASAQTVTVLRNGEEMQLAIPQSLMQSLLADKEGFANYRVPPVVYATAEGSAAQKAGLMKGDSIVGLNGTPITVFGELRTLLSSNINSEVLLDYYRNGVLYTTEIAVDSVGTLGFYAMPPAQVYQTKKHMASESFPAGIRMGVQTLKDYVAQFKYVFTKRSIFSYDLALETCSRLNGTGSRFDDDSLLSVILAFMNILPIPRLMEGMLCLYL